MLQKIESITNNIVEVDMKVLVFDTETTGLPAERNASYMETDKWPHIVQLAFILYDTEKKKLLAAHDYIVQLPEGVTISSESQQIHGISSARCRRQGVPVSFVLEEFGECQKAADMMVAHNLSFDKRVILAACRRVGVRQYFFVGKSVKPEYCTMKRTKDIPVVVATNSRGEYNKFPTLTELYCHIFDGASPRGQHDAFADILICLRCYVMLEHSYDILGTVGAIPKYYHEYAF